MTAAAAAVVAAGPASAARLSTNNNPALTYVEARAAAMNGDHARAAELLATLAGAEPDQFGPQALSEAIGAGRMDLALRVVPMLSAAKIGTDARLLMVTEAVKQGRVDRAIQWLGGNGPGGLGFLAPLLNAWDAAERGDQARALASVGEIPAKGLLAPIRDETTALILLKLRRPAEAEPYARRAIGSAGNREARVRLALAEGFLAAGDRTRAAAMLDGISNESAAAKQRILAGRSVGAAVDTTAKAFAIVLTSLASDIMRAQRGAMPIGLVQVARYGDPQNSSTSGLLAVLLDSQGRTGEALELLKSVPADDPLISQIRDVQVRLLAGHKRFDEALAIASAGRKGSDAGMSDFSRYGDVLEAMGRHAEAADAYGRALALANAQGVKSDLWPVQLLRASALEAADRWPESKAVLQQALVDNPEQPLLLNFLGYAKLERGEDVDAAEAMIRKAIELSPDNASIIDSLGWAQFKLGKVDEAIVTLQSAAEKDPGQAEIHEHLGDALYKSGRRIEARFAWSAALVTAEDEIAGRVKAKLASGLTSANAAP